MRLMPQTVPPIRQLEVLEHNHGADTYAESCSQSSCTPCDSFSFIPSHPYLFLSACLSSADISLCSTSPGLFVHLHLVLMSSVLHGPPYDLTCKSFNLASLGWSAVRSPVAETVVGPVFPYKFHVVHRIVTIPIQT